MKKILFLCFFILLLVPVSISNAKEDINSAQDFYVSEFKLYPSAPVTGQKAKIVVSVKNNGTSNIRSSVGMDSLVEQFQDFTLDDKSYPVISAYQSIAPGAVAQYVYEGSFGSAGVKNLTFMVDSADQVDEKSESNNTLSSDFRVYDPSESDLVVVKVEPNIKNPLVYEKIKVSVEVKNQGRNILTDSKGFMFEDVDTLPSIKKDISVRFDDFQMTGFTMDPYPTINTPMLSSHKIYIEGYFAKVGDKKLNYDVNVNKRLPESNFANNNASTTLKVYLNAEERDALRINNLHYELLSSTSAKFYWETDLDMTTTFSYRQSVFPTFESITSTNKKSHSATISGLMPHGKYVFKVSAVINGVNKETALGEFLMLYIEKVIISELSDNSDASKIKVFWKTNVPSDSTLFYRKAGASSDLSIFSSTLTTIHNIETDPLPDGEYSFFIKSKDSVGTSSVSQVFKANIGSNSPSGTVVDNPTSTPEKAVIAIKDTKMYESLKGRIILRVEKNGEAYYISPTKQEMYYLGRPDDAFAVMRQRGVGMSNANLDKIAISLSLRIGGPDSDGDELADLLEDAIGTSKTKKDTDGDSYDDRSEIETGYDPLRNGGAKPNFDEAFTMRYSGKIFLATERHGEAWYVNKEDKKRYFLGRPADAFNVMRGVGVGIGEVNFAKL